jgi:hypothetical protein
MKKKQAQQFNARITCSTNDPHSCLHGTTFPIILFVCFVSFISFLPFTPKETT